MFFWYERDVEITFEIGEIVLENTACVMNFGCQMNEYESLTVSKILKKAGFELIRDENQAQVVIINTCTVRDHADDKILNRLESLVPQKKKHSSKVIGLMGCMVEARKEEIHRLYPQLDFLITPTQLYSISEVLKTVIKRKTFAEYIEAELWQESESAFRSYLPVQTGCNFNCSYCIVPLVKGREINFSVDDIFLKIEKLVASGIKEITLLGQTINSYSFQGLTFADLLKRCAQNYPAVWFRFLTSHPLLFDKTILEHVASYTNLCPFFHIPSQSGSNKILKKMKRGYTREQYLDLIRTLRELGEDVCISTDMICGFPSETEEDFARSLSLMQEVRYETAFMFFYSQRRGTVAATLPDQISEEVSKKRLSIMVDLQMNQQKEIYQRFTGKTMEVLVESQARRGESQMKGRTKGNLPVIFCASRDLIGSFTNVKITSASSHSLFGELV